MITEAAESPTAWSWATWSPERHSDGGNRGFMGLWNIFAMFYWRQWHSICFFILVPWEPVTWNSWVSVQDIFPVKKFSVFYFSRCYSQQFLHFAKCTWHVICGTDCVIWVNMCGMLSAVDAGRRILQRREHIRQAESVWPVPFFAVCCYT